MLETLKNAWKVKELRNKILFTLLIIVIFRIGSVIPVPYINLEVLKATTDGSTFFSYLSILTGGGLEYGAIFAMSITPYINASIIIQLLCVAIPYLERLSKEGEEGQKKLATITRYTTVILALIQGVAYFFYLKAEKCLSVKSGAMWFAAIVIVLAFTAGSAVVMWLGEQIDVKGIGNGISILLFAGILSRGPQAFRALLHYWTEFDMYFAVIAIVIVFLAVIAFIVWMTHAERRIPVQYAKRVVGNKQYGGVRQYIPLKINAAGVMPIIFAQAIMLLPISFVNYAASESLSGFAAAFSDFTGFWYNFTFFVLIVAFTYFYTAITVNPMQMAEEMKKNGGFIPGVKPGRKTMEFLDTIMSRITLPGSIFLGIVAILPAFAQIAGVNQQFAQFYGGTSLLILVGVVLDTLQQIESHLLMRHYDGLMKTGRIKGKTPGGPAAY